MNGRSYTDFADNRDVAVFEDVALALQENEDAFGHVRFYVPDRELTQTINVDGLHVGIVHGHQFGGGANQEQKALNWWRGQMEGQHPIGTADMLISGHFHHLRVVQRGPRTWIQAPALDGGSEWWTNQTGLDSPPGTLTFTIRDGEWDHLRVV